jgi:hypothetical protein
MLQVVGIESVEQESDCCLFMVCGVVGAVGYDGVGEGGFSVYSRLRVCGGLCYGDV